VRVLIAEDEAHLGTLLEQFLIGRGHEVTLVRDGRAALDALRTRDYDVALTDVQMPGMDGLALLAAAHALPFAPEVIVVTGNGAAETQLRALRQGAYDAVAKPYRMAEIDLLVHRAAEKRALRGGLAARALADRPTPEFLTADPTLADAVSRAAGDRAPLLLVGEPGTGRRTLARWLHARAARGGAFVDVDATHAPPDARAALLGRDGTLLVRRVERIGPDDLAALVAAARASDAEHALVVAVEPGIDDAVARAPFGQAVLELPPLRDRPADVALLAESMASRAHGAPLALADDARAALTARAWPGNAAELHAVVAAAVARVSPDARTLPWSAFEVQSR
jgi:DNA-binding NtrC family response regulator